MLQHIEHNYLAIANMSCLKSYPIKSLESYYKQLFILNYINNKKNFKKSNTMRILSGYKNTKKIRTDEGHLCRHLCSAKKDKEQMSTMQNYKQN